MAIRLAYVSIPPIQEAFAVDITYDTMAMCLFQFRKLLDIAEDTMAIRLACDATLPI